MRTSNYRETFPEVPCVFKTERAARCRADAGAHSRPRGRKRAPDASEQKKKREGSEERNVKNARSQCENRRERYRKMARGSGAGWQRGDRRVAGDFARFPSTYGRRSPDRCPPTPSLNLFPHFPPLKSPLVLFLFLLLLLLPSGHPFCHRVDVNSRVQILARSKFRTGN